MDAAQTFLRTQSPSNIAEAIEALQSLPYSFMVSPGPNYPPHVHGNMLRSNEVLYMLLEYAYRTEGSPVQKALSKWLDETHFLLKGELDRAFVRRREMAARGAGVSTVVEPKKKRGRPRKA